MAGPISIDSGHEGPAKGSAYSWIVFALSFGLLISDYMARQVLNAVFPLLKVEWHLSDGQLGLLSGVVAVMVGLLTFPLSLAADRWGRVRSLALMAVLWSLATLLCAVASGFGEMLVGRALVGVGEAAYGSVGIAVVISVFPQRLRATLAAAFMAGGLFGQVLGVGIGGTIAASHGWRSAFMAIGVAGLILGVLYPLLVKERRIRAMAPQTGGRDNGDAAGMSAPLRALVRSRSVRLAYLGSGLQMFAAGAMPVWLPSFLNRNYGYAVDRAGQVAALLLLACGTGMVVCGMVSDRVAQHRPERKISLAMAYCIGTAASLALAMALPAGVAQLALIGLAMFLVAGTTGPAGAMVANLTPLAIHGSAFATLTLANNLIGLAPGPIVTGRIADALGLAGAFRILPLSCIAAAFTFAAMRRSYLADLATAKGT
ncbi:MFS transporter [Novosphingobium sp. MD-1]|uniref:MFS transporter n=1 Tax=Novosphingobium sp. MD-1 TaxID=1630648 RepID=UPI00061CA5F6|nr:MFS transporter [Novosphingobium sp. MD-1]GAO53485.1 transporter, MFS superfamily [Novosphingobium sp. MD-1]